MLRKDLVSLLYRVHFERALPAARNVPLKQLNAAELELKMAEDALVRMSGKTLNRSRVSDELWSESRKQLAAWGELCKAATLALNAHHNWLERVRAMALHGHLVLLLSLISPCRCVFSAKELVHN
jgi:hypothetical protein